jgi:hypothetical protein
MPPTDGIQAESISQEGNELERAEDALLQRVKDVSQKITDRVRKVLGDTEPHGVLSCDPTDEAPPVQ